MSQLIHSFYKNVRKICATDNVSELINYLSNDGLTVLKQLNNSEIYTTVDRIQYRDFGLILIQLIPICFPLISDNDAEQALVNIQSINSIFNQEQNNYSNITTSNLFETLDYIFNTFVHLFYFNDNHVSTPQINKDHIDIAQGFANIELPQLTTEYKNLWFYQKKIRSLLLIFKQIILHHPTTYTNSFNSNPIDSIITNIYKYLPTSSSKFLIQLGFDTLLGFALLIESILENKTEINSAQRQTTTDLICLINQFLTSDYFSLFTLLNTDQENEYHSKQLLEHCSLILKHLKTYRSEESHRKQNQRSIKTYWENSSEQAYRYHHHQSSFEILINNKSNLDENIDIKNETDENNQIKRICAIGTIYDKLLRLTIKQFESNQPSFSLIHDCLSYLISYGSCSCYSLTHYRTLLSKINHVKTNEKILLSLEQQSIQLLRKSFLLILNCSQRNNYNHYHHHHHHDSQIADNSQFWTYLSNNLFQRPSRYSLKLAQSFPDLIQCCSRNEKQSALKLCLLSSLEYYRQNPPIQNTINSEIVEYLIQTLPNLFYDITIDIDLSVISDTLIVLSSLLPTLLIHTLPVLGCLLTSTSDSLNLNISELFIQLIIKLTNSGSLPNDRIDNLCHILIILLQKCPTFRHAFYGHLCHLRLYERFQLMLNNPSTFQSSIIACILVAISYYPKLTDNDFNYKLILEQITLYSEKNRYNSSWFELLVHLSLSQQYQDKRIRWKSSISNKNQSLNESDDENPTTSSSSSVENNEEDDDDEYHADVESLSDEIPTEIVTKQNQTIYSNLILFPELVILGLEIAWQNVDNEWSNQQTTNKSSIYVTNLVVYLELLSSLVRANSYNCIVLKRLNIDGYLFTCLTKTVPRSSFIQKDTLISLIITLLQLLWSQSITVNQLDQCFKLILAHRLFVGPLLRLFKHLVHQIDSNQPRSFCSMPLSAIVTSKASHHLRLTLDQLLSLKYPSTENDQTNSSLICNNVRTSAFVTEKLKTVQFHFPLTIALWLRVNYPFDKHEINDENQIENDELNNKKDYRPILHILTLHHEGIQLQFWLDSKPNICLKIVQLSPTPGQNDPIDFNICLYNLPRESWSHVVLTISKTTNTVRVCLNGQTSVPKTYPIPSLYSSNSIKPWSISIGQQSLDTCTSFYYDLGSILLFDKVDLLNGVNNDYVPTYLYSLGSDHWHFLTGSQQQQSLVNYWIYQRFTRVHSTMSIDQFEIDQNSCHTILKRSLIASYTSNNPWTLFLFNSNTDTNEDVAPSRLNKILPFFSSTTATSTSTPSIATNDDNLLTTTTTISLPSRISLEQSSNILNICEQLGGILNFIYLFGKIIEINPNDLSVCICNISDIIFTSIWRIKSYYDLFNSLDGYRLIVKILTSNECTRYISSEFYEVLIDKCIVTNQQRLYDINLFRFILLDWKIWYNHPNIFNSILKIFNDLLSDQINSKYFYVNRQLFKTHFTLEHLLTLCQELIEEQQHIIIDNDMTLILINIIEALIENDINIIAIAMNFILLIHPLIKTYVTYNKEHFYFITKPFNYYEQHKEHFRKNLILRNNKNLENFNRRRSTTMHNNEQFDTNVINNKDNSSIKKSRSFSDLLSSSVPTTNKDCSHNIDPLSTDILRLLTNIALTTSDRLMMKLIDHVFRLNILVVLLLNASMPKRVQCIKLLDIILKRMDKDKVQNDVLRADLHIMLANQIYHQLDGRDDEKEFVEICVSIALQRPIQFNIELSLSEQIHDSDQYFSIVSCSPPCPQSQVGFALVLSFIEKLSIANTVLCELLLNLLNEIIIRSNDENRHFLVGIGIIQVLFNTLSSAITFTQDKIISSVQKCLNSLIVHMFMTSIIDDISFISIINNIIGIIMINSDSHDNNISKVNRGIYLQTLSNMFNAIIDSIEKPPSTDISSYASTKGRNTIDDMSINPTMVEHCDRFRKFLHLALDYVYSFHDECSHIETFTLRLVNICLIGIAYQMEKRSNHIQTRHQMSLIMFRCGDIIKQITQKLLTIALDPEKQSFVFRIQILKHIIEQPNAKAIMEYLLINDAQCYIYHQILIYLQILSNTSPITLDIEQMTNQNSSGQSIKSFDSGHLTETTVVNSTQTFSNGEESSHTVNLSAKKDQQNKIISNKHLSTTDEDQDVIVASKVLPPKNERYIPDKKSFDQSLSSSTSSSSSSNSISSASSEVTISQPSSTINYENIINVFRDLMRTINIPSLTSNDSNLAQRRALTDHLLKLTPATPAQLLRANTQMAPARHSFNWPTSVPSSENLTTNNTQTPVSPDRTRRRSHLSPSPSPFFVSWSSVVEEKRSEYTNTLNQIIEATQKRLLSAQKNSLKAFKEVTITTIASRAMDITQDVISLQSFERKKFLEHLRLTQSLDLRTKHLWHQLISQLTHEYGVWFESLSYPKFWELDPTESPQRERRRLQRSYCLMEKQFFQPQVPGETLVSPPLSYLFGIRHYQSANLQTVLYRNEKLEFQCRCMNVTPNNEIKGELLVGTTRIYFVADERLSTITKTKSVNSAMTTIGYNHHSFNDDSNSFSIGIQDICEMFKRRHMLKDVALELFFINGITLMIAHVSFNDRENLYKLLTKRNLIHLKHGQTVQDSQTSWKQGHMTNFDYLMQLNKLGGRSYLDLMQYPVYPYIVANYENSTLDLRAASSYRNLSKPISIQSSEKEEKVIDSYNDLKEIQMRNVPSQQNNDEQKSSNLHSHQYDPYHYSSLYSNSGVVLHYLVRLLPYTRMFLDYQDNHFDCADRTFHDVKTSYWLSSFESTSDSKEIIPEFYYLNEFLLNKQGFNFGKRQNGNTVSDVAVPTWSKRNARLFVCGLRQALESDYVTSHLHQWIDLIFGYKQTGKAALDAVNIYYSACYYGFPTESITDQVALNAYYGIIRTYGQVPKQLFSQAHPSSNGNNSTSISILNSSGNDKRNSERNVFESKLPIESIHRLIIGVRWGDFIGSYDMPSPDYITSHDCAIQVSSFVVFNTGTCIMCLPSSSLIVHNEQILNESNGEQNNISQSNSSTALPIDTMVALKWNTPDYIVRCRQLRQMKNWYNFLVPIDDQDKTTCCTSIDYRFLFMGKTSGLIEVYRIKPNKNSLVGIELIKRFLPFIAHRSPITCLHTNRQFSLLISASADGMLTLWDTNRLSYVRTYKQDNQTIYHLTSSETTGDIAYLSSSGSQWHLSYLTCNCDLIGCLTFSEQLNCLCFTSAPEGTCVNVLLGGFENGLISMWSTWDLTLLRQLDFPQLRSHPIVAMCVSKVDRRRLYVADRERHLHTIESRLSSSTSTTPPPQILFLS
ncbi:unnamed protein product [Adineta steineri]|uniref:Uncharacterized protein n=1 Tax=Adineta steineri TaxID=433720 RepID=A0A815ET02_9BILA|nr:unnamed protein product [Adineta steineri]CAF3568146.1 unnamed protein product [Adineta steineri]